MRDFGFIIASSIDYLYKYKLALISALVVICLAFFYQYESSQSKEEMLNKASDQYESLLVTITNGNEELAKTKAEDIINVYSKTPYAELSALHLVRHAVYQNNLTDATKYLQWLMDNGVTKQIRVISRIRLARIFAEMKKYKDALNLLDYKSEIYSAEINEVKGDIYVAMGDKQSAAYYYNMAIKAYPELPKMQPLLDMKIADTSY